MDKSDIDKSETTLDKLTDQEREDLEKCVNWFVYFIRSQEKGD